MSLYLHPATSLLCQILWQLREMLVMLTASTASLLCQSLQKLLAADLDVLVAACIAAQLAISWSLMLQ